MGLEFLARVRRTSTWLGGVVALMAATYVRPMLGLAFAAGVLWSLVNLQLLERLVVSLVGEKRGTPANVRRLAVALLGMPVLFGAGWVLLELLPPTALLAGFLLPLSVIVAKAGTQVLLGSRAWRALLTHRFRAAFAALALAVATWFALGALTDAGSATAQREHGAASAQATGHSDPATAAPAEGAENATAAPTEGSEIATAAPTEGSATATAEQGEANDKDQGFANVIGLIVGANPHAAWAHFLEHWEVLVFSIFIALLLLVMAFVASRNPQLVPSGFQNGVELVVEGLSNFIISIIGPKQGPRFVPFLGTLFVYILSMNLFGLIPFMHSPTASLNVTVALALTVFVYVQFIGFKELGPLGWLDHMLGSPRDVTGWMLAPLMLPIHVLGELAKPISLSCRLFGNIFGEDMLLVAFASLGVSMLPFKQIPFGIPMHALFFPLALLGSALQAMVFTVLSSIYILLMLPHEHEAGHEHEGGAQHAH
jgi:F-type H+-transporting ATPase subunit a